ncbi:MAG: cobalamin biosynthesis protein [Hydrogenoanaerobacterium sp.]
MKIAMIAFTKKGAALLERLYAGLCAQGNEVSGFAAASCCERTKLTPLKGSVTQWAGQQFVQADAIIFVSACGIAVRAIAPYVSDKFTDPAVLALDEGAGFVVPLLSGHIGGANALARAVACLCGAKAVISTATDINGVFAADLWASENNCVIADRHAAKELSSALLRGEEIGFFSDFKIDGELPLGLVSGKSCKSGVCVSLDIQKRPFACTLNLIPRIITLGIGCRRGTAEEALTSHIKTVLSENNIALCSVKGVCTVDIKAKEPCILAFCKENALPLLTYSVDELLRVKGEFTASDFVKSVIGVDNVCERAAAMGGGKIIVKKQASNGVTAALACDDWSVKF